MSLSKFAVPAALLSLVHALPQKLDFNSIDAAPTVASGPTQSGGLADQTASLYTSYTLAGATAAPSAEAKRDLPIQKRDQVISKDVTDSSNNARIGRRGDLTTVNSGVDYWINGESSHDFLGDLNNKGRIFVSQTKEKRSRGMKSEWDGHSDGKLSNAAGALIQLNDFGSSSDAEYEWDLKSMDNKGTIQWCARGDSGGSKFKLYNEQTSTNDGLISFEQFFDNEGDDFTWSISDKKSDGQKLYNNGAFRIINVNFHNDQNVHGNGCWQIGKGGILNLDDGTYKNQHSSPSPVFSGQSIFFQDSSAVLRMDQDVYERNPNFGAQLYGFSRGNAIEFDDSISSFSYSTRSGTLTVKFRRSEVHIKMGTGYDASKFFNRRNEKKHGKSNAIFYDGAAPSQSLPSQCSITAPVCSDLSGGLPGKKPGQPSATTASTTRTSSATSAASTTASSNRVTSSSSMASTTAPPTTTQPPYTPKSCPNTPYTPYYAALEKGYTTDPALSATSTTTANQPCVTQPEAGTYCGFLNPLDPCAPQPDGFGPVPTPDTASAFLAFEELHASASAAPTVIPSSEGTQYTQVFKDLDAATSAQSYLGLYTLKEYDVAECASKCDCTELCTSFNMFAERDPSLNPTNNDSTYDPGYPTVWGQDCPNPASMTSFKCTLWGSSIDDTTATNTGETRSQFQVVITASNGYDKTNVTIPPAPPAVPDPKPKDCKGKAIDAPQYWLGSKFFPGPFNPLICGDYANKQGKVNTDAGQKKVSMYNAYYLHKNGKPHGTQCALYNSVLDPGRWATYTGGDKYQCKQSWTFHL